jgi:hypothetical protein
VTAVCAAGPIHIHGAITSARPIPMASGNCPERFGRGGKRSASVLVVAETDRGVGNEAGGGSGEVEAGSRRTALSAG